LPRVCAVSFLNTVPLVWGLLHGPQRDAFDLSFAVPAECSDRLADARADIGLVPAVEVPRLGLDIVPGHGIACHSAVRSILLVSKVPLYNIRTLATDANSRTTVMLARILLAEKWGVAPKFHSMPPNLVAMLAAADAALLIGDSALRVNIDDSPFEVCDLGETWNAWSGLPMVFAVWAARRDFAVPADTAATLAASYRYGREHLDDIVASESGPRGFTPALTRGYLTRNIVFELGERDYAGLELFLKLAARYRSSNIQEIRA
jgi:predicted solute-binding protein